MRVTERVIENQEEEGVVLEYVTLTNDFAEIKEYVQHKGETILAFAPGKERVQIRIEDIFYFEAVEGLVFAYTANECYEVKGRLYQIEEKVKRNCIRRVSKTMLVHMEHIVSVRTALNGRLYAKLENGEEILITRKYAKEAAQYLMGGESDEGI